MSDPRLGWEPHKDPRSRAHRAASPRMLTARPRSYRWAVRTVGALDQGKEGACTGFGMTAELAARPAEVDVTGGTGHTSDANAYAQRLYRAAQGIDRAEGRHYQAGATMLAAAKALARTGKVTEYRWAFGLTDVLTVLGRRGPVVLGIEWWDSMYEPDGDVVRVAGSVVGGHCILARGVDVPGRRVLLRNSWGEGWGRGGDAWIGWDDLDRLLRADGEACVPVVRAR